MNIILLKKASFFLAVLAAVILLGFYHTNQNKNKNLKLAQEIYQIIDHYKVTYDIDKHSVDVTASIAEEMVAGKEQCIQRILNFVAFDRPFTMVILSFPFKSGNQEKKVLGSLPDMAERKSLEYLQQIINEINAIYKPGASLTIFCDGIMFAECLGIPMQAVIAYEKGVKALAKDLHGIRLYTSEEMLKENKVDSIDQMLSLLNRNYHTQGSESESVLIKNSDTTFKRVAFELDYPAGHEHIKKYRFEAIFKKFMEQEKRLLSYAAQKFPSCDYFYLTAHFIPDMSKEVGIKLSPTSDITPYHGVLVEEKDGSWALRFLKDVDRRLYTLSSHYINGIECLYFKHI